MQIHFSIAKIDLETPASEVNFHLILQYFQNTNWQIFHLCGKQNIFRVYLNVAYV